MSSSNHDDFQFVWAVTLKPNDKSSASSVIIGMFDSVKKAEERVLSLRKTAKEVAEARLRKYVNEMITSNEAEVMRDLFDIEQFCDERMKETVANEFLKYSQLLTEAVASACEELRTFCANVHVEKHVVK